MGAGRGQSRRLKVTARGSAPMADNKLTEANIQNGEDLYMHQVRNTRILTRGEEHKLGHAARNGDIEAQKKLVEHNQLWALKEARNHAGLGIEFNDLVQEANLGLMRAAQDYDSSKGSFITYARNWVQHFIRRAMEQKGSTSKYGSRIPAYLYPVIGKVKNLKKEYDEAGEKMDPKKIAAEVNEPVARVEAALEVLGRSFVSADKPIKDGVDGNEKSIGDLIPDSQDGQAEVESGDVKRVLKEAMETVLTEEERFVLQKRFGLHGSKEEKQKDICEQLGMTRGRVTRIESRASEKLRSYLENQGVSIS